MSKLKIAIIGLGNMGRIHAKAIKKNMNCELAYVIDNDAKTHKNFTNILNFYNLNTFLKKFSDEVDGIIISTPSANHYEIANELLDRKIPLLVEKPMATDKESVKKLIMKSKKLKTILRCGLIELYNPLVTELNQIDIEKINFVHIKRHSPIQNPKRKLENIVLDLTLHDLSLLFKLLNPTKIDIIGKSLIYKGQIAETSQILLKINDKIIVFVSSSRQDQEKVRSIEIFDEDTKFDFNLKNKTYEIKQKAKVDFFNNASISETNLVKKIDMLNRPETADSQLESFITAINNNNLDFEHLSIVEKAHNLAFKILSS